MFECASAPIAPCRGVREGRFERRCPADRRADRRLDHASSMRAAISPASWATRCCCRCPPARHRPGCCWSGLGARSAFGRKQYRKALQAAAQAVARTGAAQSHRVSRLRGGRRPRHLLPGAHRGGSRSARTRYKIPGPEDGAKSPRPPCCARSASPRTMPARPRRPAQGLKIGAADGRRHGIGQRTSRTCRPTSARRPTSESAR